MTFNFLFASVLRLFLAVIHTPLAMGAKNHQISPYPNNLNIPIQNKNKKKAKALKALLKKVENAIQNSSEKNNQKTQQVYIESLGVDLKEKIVSQNLTARQAIVFLKDTVSNEKITSEKRLAAIKLMGELLKQYPSSDTLLSEIIDLLTDKFSKWKENPYERQASIQLTGELLKKYTLPDTLKALNTIDLLKNIKTGNPFTRSAAIQAIGELAIKYTLSPPKILEMLHFLRTQLSSKRINNYIAVAIIESMTKILERYSFPKREALASLHQIKENLFHENGQIREAATQSVIKIIKTSKITETGTAPDTEIDKVISWIIDHLSKEWWSQVSALENLNEFLKKDIPADPDKKTGIITAALKQLDNKHWAVRYTTIQIINTFLKQQHFSLLNTHDKEKIFAILPEWLVNDRRWEARKEAIEISEALINHIDLSLSEAQTAVYEAAPLIFDNVDEIRQIALRIIKSLWMNDKFPLSEKIKMRDFLLGEIMHNDSSTGKIEALTALQEAVKQESLSPGFDVVYEMKNRISDLSDLGKAAEMFAKEYLKDNNSLEETEVMLMRFEIEEQISMRNAPAKKTPAKETPAKETPAKETPGEMTGCENSIASTQSEAKTTQK